MPSSATRRLDKEATPLTHLRQARAPVRRHPQRSAPQDNVFFTVETGCCHMANNNEIVLFTSGDGEISLPVNLEEETVWLSQAQMSSLFGKERSVITKHINNVFIEHELVKEGNVQYLHITGSAKPVAFYSLDVIISVGYRVKSQRGVEFRRWATGVLRQYILEGHVENERRLRQLGSVVNIIERIPNDIGSRELLDIIESYTDHQEPLVHRWEQTHRMQPIPILPRPQRHLVPRGRKAHSG